MPITSFLKRLFLSILVICSLTYRNSAGDSLYIAPYKYYYTMQTDNQIKELDRVVRRKTPKLESNLGVALPPEITIYLTATMEEFNQLTRGSVPQWAGGVAYPSRSLIIVKTPTFYSETIATDVLVIHEIAHLLIHLAVGENYLPRWMDEGLAQILSGELRSRGMSYLSRAASADRLMGLPRVDQVLSFPAGTADLAYAEARSATLRLVDKYGWESVRSLLLKVGSGEQFEEAFEQAIGRSYTAFQYDWMDSAHSRHKFMFLLDFDHLLWTGIFAGGTVILLYAYIRQRMRLKQMPENEEENVYSIYDDNQEEFGKYEDEDDEPKPR